MRITCCFPEGSEETAAWVQDLRAAIPGAEVQAWTGKDEPAEYAVVWRPSQRFFDQHPRLKAVFNAGAGVDALLHLKLPQGTMLVRLEDAGMAEQMAEYVAHAVLHHFREFDAYALQARERQWQERPPRRKSDYPVGVLGFGVLGSVVAATLTGLGFTVSAWSRERKQATGVRMYAGDAELDEFLAGTRILVCLLPLTSATHGILNGKTFATLRPGSYIVNVARGGHLVEGDLVEAIASGRVAGATLDVFAREPPDSASPLWDLPQVRITPHISAATLRSESVQQIARKLQALEEGHAISGMIDMTRGY